MIFVKNEIFFNAECIENEDYNKTITTPIYKSPQICIFVRGLVHGFWFFFKLLFSLNMGRKKIGEVLERK